MIICINVTLLCVCVHVHVCVGVCLCVCTRPDLTKAALDTHNEHIHFPPPVDSFIHQLTTDDYFTVQSPSVCAPHGLFLWPVWYPQGHGCSLNNSGCS